MITLGERTKFANTERLYETANAVIPKSVRDVLVPLADIATRTTFFGLTPRSTVMARTIREYLAERLRHANL